MNCGVNFPANSQLGGRNRICRASGRRDTPRRGSRNLLIARQLDFRVAYRRGTHRLASASPFVKSTRRNACTTRHEINTSRSIVLPRGNRTYGSVARYIPFSSINPRYKYLTCPSPEFSNSLRRSFNSFATTFNRVHRGVSRTRIPFTHRGRFFFPVSITVFG